MAAKLIFKMSNPNTQHNGSSMGECTAASLAWARRCLKSRGRVNSYNEIGINPIALGAQMSVIRKMDADAGGQTMRTGLKVVNDYKISSLDDLITYVKLTPPHVAIFWNSFHTMGYRYSHNEKEFFDLNEGLFRAQTSAEIKDKIKESFRNNNYGSVEGVRIVSL